MAVDDEPAPVLLTDEDDGMASTPAPPLSATQASFIAIPMTRTATAGEQTKKSRLRRILEALKAQWFMFGMVGVIVLAYYTRDIGRNGGPLHPEYTVQYGVIILIFLLNGLALKTSALKSALLNFKLQILSQIMIFGVTPFLGWLVALGASLIPDIDPDLIIGIIIIGCLPTTVSSCAILAAKAKGNESATITVSVLANILGVFASPMLLLLFLGESSDFNMGNVFLKLTITVLIPMFVGQLISFFFPNPVKKLREKVNFNLINQYSLLLFLYSTFCNTFAAEIPLTIGALFGVVGIVIGLHVVYLAVSFGVFALPLMRFTRPDAICGIMCSAQKTLGVGMPLIAILYDASTEHASGIVALPLLMYHPLQLVMDTLITGALARWVERSRERDDAILQSQRPLSLRSILAFFSSLRRCCGGAAAGGHERLAADDEDIEAEPNRAQRLDDALDNDAL